VANGYVSKLPEPEKSPLKVAKLKSNVSALTTEGDPRTSSASAKPIAYFKRNPTGFNVRILND
jgi:hypothetical protein